MLKLQTWDVALGSYVFLRKRNYNYIYRGYDINPKMIEYCKRKFKSNLFYISDEPTEGCDLQ